MKSQEKALKKLFDEGVAETQKHFITFSTLQELVQSPQDALIKRARRAGFKIYMGDYPGARGKVSMLRREDAVEFVAYLTNPRPAGKNFLA